MGCARTFLSLLVIVFESITIRPTTKHSCVLVSRPSLRYIGPTLPFFNGFKSIYTSKMPQEVKTLYILIKLPYDTGTQLFFYFGLIKIFLIFFYY